MTPYSSTSVGGRDGFAQLLRAEWTKLRTVRGWVIAMAVAIVLLVGFGLLTAAASRSSYSDGPGRPEIIGHPYVPIGPDIEAVIDTFTFAHQPVTGDGGITVRIADLTGGRIQTGPGGPAGPDPLPVGPDGRVQTDGALEPWAKAGLMIKASTEQGSAYAAIMVTGDHGVRMQYNYTGDSAGPGGAVSASSPRWLRLTRTGDLITGSSSTDGMTWTVVDTVRLKSLPQTVQSGLFATSPFHETNTQHLGGGGMSVGGPTLAIATFDAPELTGGWTGGAWTNSTIGTPVSDRIAGALGVEPTGDGFTVTGAGNIAPGSGGIGTPIERVLIGAFAALIVFAVLAVLSITGEYRRAMIRTTLTASPRRGRVLAAKAVVLGAVAFVITLVATAATVPIARHLLVANGNFVYPITSWTEVRLVGGTAAVVAVTTVLALAIGSILRRSAGAVAAVVVLVVLPYIFATAAVLPAGPSQWLLRLSPAAGFAIQQTLPAYPQVDAAYTPAFGYFPLSPWLGFAVLCAYAVAALGLATYLLRRRDV